MFAFATSILVMVVLCLIAVRYSRRRPAGTPLTWGEAMAAAVYTFFVFFWAYGVLPHLWLTYANSELKWNEAKSWHGPGGILKSYKFGGRFPWNMNYRVVTDTVAVLIYLVIIGANVWFWGMWQKRGKAKTTTVEKSAYGRPLIKAAKSAG